MAAALRTLLGSALQHARQSSNDNDNEKLNGIGSVFTNLLLGNSKTDKADLPSYALDDNSDNSVSSNVINTSPDYNTIKTWFLKLSQLALPDRQSTYLADDPKQLNAALWSLINLARYFLCKFFFCCWLFQCNLRLLISLFYLHNELFVFLKAFF